MVGLNLPLKDLKMELMELWSVTDEELYVVDMMNGYDVIHLSSVEACQRAWQGNPWSIRGHPLVMSLLP